jgi:hypothetical protein
MLSSKFVSVQVTGGVLSGKIQGRLCIVSRSDRPGGLEIAAKRQNKLAAATSTAGLGFCASDREGVSEDKGRLCIVARSDRPEGLEIAAKRQLAATTSTAGLAESI